MSKPKWIATADRRPKNHREVVGWYGKPLNCALVVERCGSGWYDDTGGEFGPPLAWFRMPKPPKGLEKREDAT